MPWPDAVVACHHAGGVKITKCSLVCAVFVEMMSGYRCDVRFASPRILGYMLAAHGCQ